MWKQVGSPDPPALSFCVDRRGWPARPILFMRFCTNLHALYPHTGMFIITCLGLVGLAYFGIGGMGYITLVSIEFGSFGVDWI